MAGWSVRDSICRHLFLTKGFVEVALIFITLCMSLSTTSYAQQGFLSIDCGYTGANYVDPNTNLTWTADNGTYIRVGDSYKQSAFTSSDGGGPSLQSFRFFAEPRSKYCYELPTVDIGAPYLIRASFYLNETVLNERSPFQFILSLDATNWFTLTSGEDSLPDLLAVVEAIFHPRNNVTNVCLVPVTGVPFISSLELRLLNDTMYSYSGDEMEYLTLLFRYNLGAPSSIPSVRFPDDKFDRIWQTPKWYTPPSIPHHEVNISIPNPPDNETRADANYVPLQVMQDGWLLNYTSNPASNNYYGLNAPLFTLYSQYLPVYMAPAKYAYSVVYVEHLNHTDSKVYTINVTLDSSTTQKVNFTNQASMIANQYLPVSSNSMQIALQSDLTIEDGPTMNAVEVYGHYDYNFSWTDPLDVVAITALKASLNLTDWQGDPCTPVPYDWIECNVETIPQTVTFTDYQNVEKPCGLNGTSIKYCAGNQGTHFLDTTFSVTSLNIQNLSTESFLLFTSATANNSAIWLNNLFEMSFTHSQFNSETLHLILENFLQWLYGFGKLDLSYNVISNIPIDWSAVTSLQSLNLSHNQIEGIMSTFDNVTLQTLDLSYNKLNSLPTTWTETSLWNNTLGSLAFLDLSYNQLQGQISSLDQLVQINRGSLQEIHVSNNNLNGSFSSSLYFSGLPNLTIANFDNNNIQGTLNLSVWLEELQKATLNNSTRSIVTRQLFSFVNNSISDVFPNAAIMLSAIDIVMEMYPSFGQQNGVLLGGNPYCSNANQYAQQYLCRYTPTQSIPNYHKNQTYILIVAVCGGVLALLLSTITSATVWRLWRQVLALRAIQQALADRQVQPPFYQYNDLKLATKDFHTDNKLGHGGFGIVYMGVLPDGTKLAVKKLFSSRRSHARDDLNEFLNEVMLITGIKHRNLVQLKGCCIKDKQRLLVYEYVEKGNLAEALWGSRVHGGLNWNQRFNICVGVARGLSYLHEELQPSIIHRDIKPENILLDNNYKPKIADFGLARHSTNDTNEAHYTANIAGTLGYFAPEYASEGQLSDKADVYSFGIVLLEIVTGRKCINHSLSPEEVYLKDWVKKMHNKGLLFDVLQTELRDNCVVDEALRTIKVGLLCVQGLPGSRPSMSQVVTMLLGSTDMKVVFDETNEAQDFKDIWESIDNSAHYPVLETVVEDESDDYLFLNSNGESSSISLDSRPRSRPIIELTSKIKGR